ncbi:MAG: RIP metalloprotease RseP [Pseudomonadales bacterium]
MEFLQYLFYLLLTLGILVTVHEFGHFFVARMSGVHVVRFSVGFGRPLLKYTDSRGTEFVLAIIPVGGYVQMREEESDQVADRKQAVLFPDLSVGWRIAIALGGPVANFLFAWLVYWVLFAVGTTAVVPILGSPGTDTAAHISGIRGGEEIIRVDEAVTSSWSQVNMQLAARLGDSGEIKVTTRRLGRSADYWLPIDRWHVGVDDPNLMDSLGLTMSFEPVIARVEVGSVAETGGLLLGDRILSINDEAVTNWMDFVDHVRQGPGTELVMLIQRQTGAVYVSVTPEKRIDVDGAVFGFVGVAPVIPTRKIQFSIGEALWRGIEEVQSKTALTLGLVKKMVLGLVSARNLSGPITIAKVAGDSAQAGWEEFFNVLALLSISLGVINLLPIPLLDGGHVLFYGIEIVIGKPVPTRVQTLGVQIGIVAVAGLIVLAFYNDLTRLLG